MLKSNHTTPSTLTRLVLVLMLTVSTVSCNNIKRSVQIVERTHHDTLQHQSYAYDSIYIDSRQSINRSDDTVYIDNIQREYKFKFFKDTIKVVKVDSIPVIKTITVEKSVKCIPSWCKWLSGIGVISVLLMIVMLIRKFM